MVCQVRAAFATFLPSWAEHEVINDQLAATVEEIGQRFFAIRSVKNVLLLNSNPWQFASMPAHFVAELRQFLLTRQQILARDQPLSF
jgi:hypothetical protein